MLASQLHVVAVVSNPIRWNSLIDGPERRLRPRRLLPRQLPRLRPLCRAGAVNA